MAEAAALSYRVYDLPWTTGAEQEQRFRRQLSIYVGVALAAALILSFLPVPERDPAELEEIPERYARLLIEEVPPPPPPPPVVREEPEPVLPEEPVTEPERVVEEVEAEPIAPEPVPAPVDEVAQARERASVAGLLPFAQELATLRDVEIADSIDATAGSGDEPVAVTERSLIAANVGASSGGIDTSKLSRDTGGAGLGARATTQVESPVEGFGPAGGAVTRTRESNLGSRSREEIERVFDRNKGAIYALYNRALRADPTLQGKVVLRLTIMPDGRVGACEIVSSELGDPELEERLVQRVLLFQFEAKDVEAVTTTKPIDFFPA